MIVRDIKLNNFRNHSERSFAFEAKVTAIVGNNGTGKTNLLDAVYYLCLTKSNLYADDKQNVKHGSDFFRLEGNFELKNENTNVVCKYSGSRKKEFFFNEIPYTKLSEHIGKIPCVMICPADAEIVLGGSEERRKVIDNTLSQTDQQYLNNLVQYNKVLAQRNAALKQFAETGKTDKNLLTIYNEQLVAFGNYIFEKRAAAFKEILLYFKQVYSQISDAENEADFSYKSQLENNNFAELLEKNLQRDLILERTEIGIHKDDVEFFLHSFPLKRFGSQGQQKSFMLAFKLAMFLYLQAATKTTPILLVDDVFDKLDKKRGQNLLNFFNSDKTTQVILSHTKTEDFKEVNFVEILSI